MHVSDIPTRDIYMADVGVITLNDRTFVGAFGQMTVPDDVWRRGFRLERRGFAQRYDYMARWCAYRLQKAWEAGGVPSKVDGSGLSHG